MAGYLKPYKSYVFRDKDPVIDLMRTAVDDTGASWADIQENSGVNRSTLRGWFRGKTRRPQFATCQAAMHAIGRDFVLVAKSVKKK